MKSHGITKVIRIVHQIFVKVHKSKNVNLLVALEDKSAKLS